MTKTNKELKEEADKLMEARALIMANGSVELFDMISAEISEKLKEIKDRATAEQ